MDTQLSVENELTHALIWELNFSPSTCKRWVQNDEKVSVGGVDEYAYLPARIRVSRAGTLAEIGVRREDLAELLAAVSTFNPGTGTVDSYIRFWDRHPKVHVLTEGEWIYVGLPIAGTKRGLEEAYAGLTFAANMALRGAFENKTLKAACAEPDSPTCAMLKTIEEGSQGRTTLFHEAPLTCDPDQAPTLPKVAAAITADTLSDYPIDVPHNWLHGLPGTILDRGGETVPAEFDICAHNGRETVDIGIDPSDRGRSRYALLIPDGVTVDKISDLQRLRTLQPYDREPSLIPVRIEVQPNTIKVTAEDGNLAFEIAVRECTVCKTPYWKFRIPSYEEVQAEMGRELYGFSCGGGSGFQCFIEENGEAGKLHCIDCAQKWAAGYKERNPAAEREAACGIASRALHDAGYTGIQVTALMMDRETNGWEVFPFIELQRGPRTITRIAGFIHVQDSGEVEMDLHPRSFLDHGR